MNRYSMMNDINNLDISQNTNKKPPLRGGFFVNINRTLFSNYQVLGLGNFTAI
jgi:hypothetical protein